MRLIVTRFLHCERQTYYYGKVSWKVAQVIAAREKFFQIRHIKVSGNTSGIKEYSNFEKGGATDEVVLPFMERDEMNKIHVLPYPRILRKWGLTKLLLRHKLLVGVIWWRKWIKSRRNW